MTDFVPGGIANASGDLFGTSPYRVIGHGKVVIDAVRAGAALMCGWRSIPKVVPSFGECDPDFAWLERTEDEREAERKRAGAAR